MFAPTQIAHAAPSTCSWTGLGDGTNWSDSANWTDCGGTAPQDGDSLVFDTDNIFFSVILNNDIPGLQLDSVAFTGTTGTGEYEIDGEAFSLSGGMSDTSSFGGNMIANNGITLTADQTFYSTGGLALYTSELDIGTHTLVASGTGYVNFGSPIRGTGVLRASTGTGTFVVFNRDNPNFSGTLAITQGIVELGLPSTSTALGTADVTIAAGATLLIGIQNNGNYSISNAFTLNGGTGLSGQGAIKVASTGGSGTVTFSGPFVLTADTQLGMQGSNATITGSVSGCFSMTKTSGSTGSLTGNLDGSCPTPADPLVGSSSSSHSGTVTAPKTGYGTPTTSPVLLELAAGFFVAAGLACHWHQRKHSIGRSGD